MSIVLSGWPTHVLEAACSLLCYFSTEKRIDPSGAAGQGSAELKSSEVDFPPPWLPLLTQDWSLDSHFSLILLLDYLDVPVAVPPMLVWLAKLASERSLSSTEPVLPVLSRLPPHLLTLFIENLHPDVWFDFRCRGDATSLFSSASGEFALWVHWYLAFLRTRLEFSRREDVFRTYGKSSSRDLTELPPQLQVWYDDFAALDKEEDSFVPAHVPEAVDELLKLLAFMQDLTEYTLSPFARATVPRPASRYNAPKPTPDRFPPPSDDPVVQPSVDVPIVDTLPAVKSPIMLSSSSPARKSAGAITPIFGVSSPSRGLAVASPTRVPPIDPGGLSIQGLKLVSSPSASVTPVPVVSPVFKPRPAVRPARVASSPTKTLREAVDPMVAIRNTAAIGLQRLVRGALDRSYCRYCRLLRWLDPVNGLLDVCCSVPSLFGCTAFTDRLVSGLGSTPLRGQLRVLDLRGCRGLLPASVGLISRSMQYLLRLDLSWCAECGDEDLKKLSSLVNLQSLQLIGWTKLTSQGLLSFATALPVNSVRPAIEKDNVRLSHSIRASLPELACASLLNLNLADCTALTSEGVSRACDALPGLLDLCLFGCLQLNDTALLGLGRTDARIQKLNLAGVYKVTTAGTQYLFSQHPTLKLYSNPNEFEAGLLFTM